MQIIALLLLCISPFLVNAQHSLTSDQQEALQLLGKLDTTKTSVLWPNIPPSAFYENVKKNIEYPERIYQGHMTNFCGYSALSVILCREQPKKYVKHITELFVSGETELNGKIFRPTEAVRKMAGDLKGKGKLIINPADQLWLMSLADYFKSYMNVDRKYNSGDENLIWAACTLGKFNTMSRVLGDYETTSFGTDLLRPGGKNNFEFIRGEMDKGVVVLFVNSKFLHPSKFRIFVLQAPTHFIIAYDIQKVNGVIELKYWDYGLKTVELMTPKQLKKMTYGIVRLNRAKSR
jgi:hypothetical protein